MFKRLAIAIVVLGLVVGGIVWFKYFRDDMIQQFMAGNLPPPVAVNAEAVKPVTWRPGIDAIGTASAVKGVDLAVEAGGQVRDLLFEANALVKKGQPLVQIDDASEQASLVAAQAALTVAVAEANRARTLSDRGVGAATTVETADAEAESAKAQVAQIQTALDNKKMAAPFDGIIGIPQIEVGQYVAAGTVFATLQDLEHMRVDFAVPEQEMADLVVGGPVAATSEAGSLKATGRIIAVEPRVDPSSRMVSVRAEVDNASGKLYPGQFLRVRIELPPEDGVIAVPQTAVSSTLYGDTIFVVQDEGGAPPVVPPAAPEAAEAGAEGATPQPAADEKPLTAKQVFVRLGRRSGSMIEVLHGIAAGDVIVTSGQNRLASGAHVRIDNSVALDATLGQP